VIQNSYTVLAQTLPEHH